MGLVRLPLSPPPITVGSQLAGDALLLALTTGAAGAAPIAERCAAALRTRGWEGDEELASQLDAARGTPTAAPTRRSRSISTCSPTSSRAGWTPPAVAST
jgi:hypothetical protein